MGETIISLEKIQKSYGKNRVLKGVDLDIHKGDIFGLVGKNGSGKTTIFKIILGLSDYQDGTLKIGEGSLEEGRKKIGFFVGPHYFPYMTGRQNMEYYRRLKNISDPAETVYHTAADRFFSFWQFHRNHTVYSVRMSAQYIGFPASRTRFLIPPAGIVHV